MKITKHIKKKTQEPYWIATPETPSQQTYLDTESNGFMPAKFGGGYMTYDEMHAGTAIGIWCSDGDTSSADTDPESTDYAKMTVAELRKTARDKGWTGAEMLNGSKVELIHFMETGEKPVKQGAVNMEEIGLKLAELIGQIGGKGAGVDEEAVKFIVQEEMKNAVHRIEVMNHVGEVVPVGIQHFLFETLFKIASCSDSKDGVKTRRPLDTMLVGPAGAGKTHVCEAIAVALGIDFVAVSVGPQTTKTDLLGYMDAQGRYVETPLYKAYKEGWMYLMDEMDAGNGGVLTIMNAMLANGSMVFPNGEVVKRNANFICFAACNTYGRGADRLFVGRNQLDAASLDRFIVVDFEYDEAMERVISGGTPRAQKRSKSTSGGTMTTDEWIDRVQVLRKAAADLKERVVISPRASQKGAMLLAAGFSRAEVENMAIWKGMDQAIRSKIENFVK